VPTYLFRCRTCGRSFSADHPRALLGEECPCSKDILRRDYRGEGVGFNTATLKKERDFGVRAHKDMFLPTAKDFAGPADPEGTKGIREWAEEHKPKDTNKRPDWPDIPKRSF
jgi:hypothetical protein